MVGLTDVHQPRSAIAETLEHALADRDWAAGRVWNVEYQTPTMADPIRIGLLWLAERCVVEIDGPDRLAPHRFADDRRRDVGLQLDGYAVLRFTDDQIVKDTPLVLAQLRQFLDGRRSVRRLPTVTSSRRHAVEAHRRAG
jgi:very-short-patch-repair endonuclease